MDKRIKPGDLPQSLKGVQSGAWQSVVRASQGNFDHLMGVIRSLVRGHNSLVDDVSDLKDYTEAGLEDTAEGQHTHQNTGEGHDGGVVYAAGIDHGGLAGLGDDDHPQYTTTAEAQALVDTHTGDTADAHDASAISILDSALQYTATDVEAALAEVLDAEQAHEADAADAHDASAISILDTANDFTATDVEGALAELQSDNESYHHAEDHDHDGSPTQKLAAANTHESPAEDTHHAKGHALEPAAGLHTGTLDADNVELPVVGTPVEHTLNDWFDIFGSTGVNDPDREYVTNKDADEVTVAAGEGFIRTSNDPGAALKFIEWPAIDLVVGTVAQDTD